MKKLKKSAGSFPDLRVYVIYECAKFEKSFWNLALVKPSEGCQPSEG